MNRRPLSATRLGTALCTLLLAASLPCVALENQTSTGQVALVDTPILRVPMIGTPPEIDGDMVEGEWEDASALSAFWYDYGQAAFFYMAPHQTQLRVLVAYDKEHLYLCYDSPIYPENSWLKARGRMPDVISHARYGLQWDDHVEIELRPIADNTDGYRRGLFKWFVNPINNISDQYWSLHGGPGLSWPPNQDDRMIARSKVDGKRWVLEMKIPLTSMVHDKYAEERENGTPVVDLPLADGTAFRAWFTRSIGGNGAFFNVFDNHSWNTTKTKLIFDSEAVGFQVLDMGEVLNDEIDVTVQLKNHNSRSETVQLGFFVENAEGLIYSSYDDDATEDGLVELKPDEVKRLTLRKRFPGISTDGNTLWFDVRSAGTPAKPLFRTRLIDFHSMQGGVVDSIPFKWRRIDVIERIRPPRKDFEFDYAWSPYQEKLSAIVDKGIYGASEDAKRATEARLVVLRNDLNETEVAEQIVPFRHDVATFLVDLEDLDEGEYKVSLLLFDENKRIVGEANPPFFRVKNSYPWVKNDEGKSDTVWAPFTPIEADDEGFETLKHRFTVGDHGLPAQIAIKAGTEDLPLDQRDVERVDPAILEEIGRGEQLRAPMRLVAVIDGEEVAATVTEPAQRVRTGESEVEYRAAVRIGDLPAELDVRYDCDGSLHASLTYGGAQPVTVDKLMFEMDVRGRVDTRVSAKHGGGMSGVDQFECALRGGPGIVWDSTEVNRAELYYSHFVPFFWFGSGDRGFSWYADSDQFWELDKDGSALQLERDEDGQVTLRVFFVNHRSEIADARTLDFSILVHPAKPKPADHRRHAWFYRGKVWAADYPGVNLVTGDGQLHGRRLEYMIKMSDSDRPDAAELEKMMHEDPYNFDVKNPPWIRHYQLRGLVVSPVPAHSERAYTGEFTGRSEPIKSKKERGHMIVTEDGGTQMAKPEHDPGVVAKLNRAWEDFAAYHFGRHARLARRAGWWWDETWPAKREGCIATGGAYIRDPEEYEEGEIPWQDTYTTTTTRNTFKRILRIYKEAGLTSRQNLWANNAATGFESFAWSTQLVEGASADMRSQDIDNIVAYPISLFRYSAHSYTGLIAHMVSGGGVHRGGDKVYDRQYIGRCLLHDIGITPIGAHGRFAHVEQFIRVLRILHDFGYFEEQGTEWIPYWRTGDKVRLGDPEEDHKLYASIFKRKREGGGTKVLMLVMNEFDEDRTVPITITDPETALGGRNVLTAAAIREGQVPEDLSDWWAGIAGRDAETVAIKDAETGEAILRDGDVERYPTLWVPAHDYRLLYLEAAP